MKEIADIGKEDRTMTKAEVLAVAKPILFNTEMVRAILDGRKTVTRRVVKPPYFVEDDSVKNFNTTWRSAPKGSLTYRTVGEMPYPETPYQAGDYLYVRETWRPVNKLYPNMAIDYAADWSLAHFENSRSTSSCNEGKLYKSKEMGEGYNEERKKGLQSQIDWMSGEQGKTMMEGNALIGQYWADLKNQLEQSIMDARDSAMQSDEYQKAILEGNGAEAGRILMEAETKAKINYQESDAYKLQLESQKTMVGKLREALVEDGSWEKFGYDMGLEFSYGMQRAGNDLLRGLRAEGVKGSGVTNYLTGESRTDSPDNAVSSYAAAGQYAYGMIRVPFDNFPAMLHEASGRF